MCHTVLQDPNFFRLLLCIDQELAEELKAGGCECGGVLHRADYPRKPRGCLAEVRSQFESRWSFCCNRCRKRSTSMSVRFLGRRVYVAVAVVVASAQRAGASSPVAQLARALSVPVRTLERWRGWWWAQFPLTALWRGACGRFMPPVASERLPGSALERFAGTAAQSMRRFLMFLTPLTVGRLITLPEAR
ncbi:MAG TPA: hypothetical protein VI545_07220 [Burkholderiales bacterium]|nr:hypothetical protein [Burkholderiales bacterium]